MPNHPEVGTENTLDHELPFLHCAQCGERIGIYEAVWAEPADGPVRPSSFLNLANDAVGEGQVRFWHLGCLAPDSLPGTPEAEVHGSR